MRKNSLANRILCFLTAGMITVSASFAVLPVSAEVTDASVVKTENDASAIDGGQTDILSDDTEDGSGEGEGQAPVVKEGSGEGEGQVPDVKESSGEEEDQTSYAKTGTVLDWGDGEEDAAAKQNGSDDASAAKSAVLTAGESAAENGGVMESGSVTESGSVEPANAAATAATITTLTTQLFYGASKQDDGTYVWDVGASGDVSAGHRFAFRVNYSISSDQEISANIVEFRIPASILKDREENAADATDWSIPSEADIESALKSDGTYDEELVDASVFFAWKQEGDEIVIYNFRPMSTKDLNGYFELAYLTSKTTLYYEDMAEMNPFTCTMKLGDGTAEDITKEADQIVIKMDTDAEVTSVSVQDPGSYAGSWNDSWGTDIKPEYAGDYYYLVWPVRSGIAASQPYSYALSDVSVAGNYDDMKVIGVKMAGEDSYHAFGDDGTYTVNDQYIRDYRTDYVLTAIKKEAYDPKDNWEATLSVKGTLTPKDGQDDATTKTGSHKWTWQKPHFHEPGGNFNTFKRGDGAYRTYDNDIFKGTTHYAGSAGFSAARYTRYDLDSFSGYNKSSKTLSSYGGFDFASWIVGYPGSNTLDTSADGYDANEPWNSYWNKAVKYELIDDGVFLLKDTSYLKLTNGSSARTIENKSIDGAGAVKLTSSDFRISSISYSFLARSIGFNENSMSFDGTSDVTTFKDGEALTFYAHTDDGEWQKIAVYDWHNGTWTYVAEGVNASGNSSGGTLSFGESLSYTGYKVETENAYYYSEIFTVPSYELKNSDTVMNLLSGTDNMVLLDNNEGYVYAQDSDGNYTKEIHTSHHSDTDYARTAERSSSLTKSVLGTSNNTRKKYYTITWEIKENETITYGGGTMEDVDQQGGTFYDLLPQGSNLDTRTLQVMSGDTILPETAYSYKLIQDYGGTDRTMLVVQVKETGALYRVTFDTRITWNSLADYGTEVYNPTAYRTGNDAIYKGSDDDGGNLQEKSLMTRLVSGTGLPESAESGDKFLYAENSWNIQALTSAANGLSKKIKSSDANSYTSDTDLTIGDEYSYELRYMNSYQNNAKNIIIFDSIENYSSTRYGIDGSDWKGTFQSIEAEQAKEEGAAPVIYVSAVEDLSISAHTGLTDTEKWTELDDYTGDKADITAVAVDLSKKADGTDFILGPGGSLAVHLYMKAPATAPDTEDRSSVPYAYNGFTVTAAIYQDNDSSAAEQVLSQGYTSASLKVAGDLNINKINQDTKEAASGITFRIYGTSDYGTAVDEKKASDKNGTISFEKLEKGSYTLQEYDSTDDYFIDLTEYTVKIDNTGKTWVWKTEEGEGKAVDYTGKALTLENKPRVHTDIELYKARLGVPETKIAGARYRLKGTSDYGNDVLLYADSEGSDGEPGRMLFENVEKGTYELTEITAPENYIKNDNVYRVTVDENAAVTVTLKGEAQSSTGEGTGSSSGTGTTTNSGTGTIWMQQVDGDWLIYDEKLHDVSFLKKSTEEGFSVKGAEFTLTGTSDNGTAVDKAAVADEKGEVLFEGLEPGSYLMTETKAPDGHASNETQYIVTVPQTGDPSIAGTGAEKNKDDIYVITNRKLANDEIVITKVWDDGKEHTDPDELDVTITTKKPETEEDTVIMRIDNGNTLTALVGVPKARIEKNGGTSYVSFAVKGDGTGVVSTSAAESPEYMLLSVTGSGDSYTASVVAKPASVENSSRTSGTWDTSSITAASSSSNAPSGKAAVILTSGIVKALTASEVDSLHPWKYQTSAGAVKVKPNPDYIYLEVTLDDITQSSGNFKALFPALTAGENITVFAAPGLKTWSELVNKTTGCTKDTNRLIPDATAAEYAESGSITDTTLIRASSAGIYGTTNSLFADGSLASSTRYGDRTNYLGGSSVSNSTKTSNSRAVDKSYHIGAYYNNTGVLSGSGTAVETHVSTSGGAFTKTAVLMTGRHLQNLENTVSGVNASGSNSKMFTTAELHNDILWADYAGKDDSSSADYAVSQKLANAGITAFISGSVNSSNSGIDTSTAAGSRTQIHLYTNDIAPRRPDAGRFQGIVNNPGIGRFDGGMFYGVKGGTESGTPLYRHTIYNLAENAQITDANGTKNNIGLFARIDKNVTSFRMTAFVMKDPVSIDTRGSAGLLIGYKEPVSGSAVQIDNVTVTSNKGVSVNSTFAGNSTGGGAGGLIGYVNGGDVSINNSAINAVDITVSGPTSGTNLGTGGLISYVNGGDVSITNSAINAVNITVSGPTSGTNVGTGGMVGFVLNGSLAVEEASVVASDTLSVKGFETGGAVGLISNASSVRFGPVTVDAAGTPSVIVEGDKVRISSQGQTNDHHVGGLVGHAINGTPGSSIFKVNCALVQGREIVVTTETMDDNGGISSDIDIQKNGDAGGLFGKVNRFYSFEAEKSNVIAAAWNSSSGAASLRVVAPGASSGFAGCICAGSIKFDGCHVIGGGDNDLVYTDRNAVGGLAGILIGSENGDDKEGLITISNSSSSVYLEGGANSSYKNHQVGGLIGEIASAKTGSVIQNCYVGGRTSNGKYVLDYDRSGLEGYRKKTSQRGRFNIQDLQTDSSSTGEHTGVGGLIGSVGSPINYSGGVSTITIENCYTTASVYSASATGQQATVGSLLGQVCTDSEVTINNCYSTGLVGTAAASGTSDSSTVLNSVDISGHGFIGTVASGTVTGTGNYYLKGVQGTDSGGNTVTQSELFAGSSGLTVTGASDGEAGTPFAEQASPAAAHPYDSSLDSTYPFNAKGFTEYYGDWPATGGTASGVKADNTSAWNDEEDEDTAIAAQASSVSSVRTFRLAGSGTAVGVSTAMTSADSSEVVSEDVSAETVQDDEITEENTEDTSLFGGITSLFSTGVRKLQAAVSADEIHTTVDGTWETDDDGDYVIPSENEGENTVKLEISTDAEGRSVWTYTFYVTDNTKNFYVYENMNDTSSGEKVPAEDGVSADYTSEGSDGAAAVESDPGVVDKDTHAYTITNTLDLTPDPDVPDSTADYGTLIVSKTVQGTVPDSSAQFPFTITLAAGTSDADLSGIKIYDGIVFTDGVGHVSLADGQSVTINSLPAGMTYSVSEGSVNGYTLVSSSGESGAIGKGTISEALFTNEINAQTDDTKKYGTVHLKKLVSGTVSSDTLFTFHAVFAGLESGRMYTDGSQYFTADGSGNADVTVQLAKDGIVNFADLPENATYQFVEEAGNYTASYEVSGNSGAVIASSGNANTTSNKVLTTAVETVDESETAGNSVTVTYTNRMPDTQNLTLAVHTEREIGKGGNSYEIDDSQGESFTYLVHFENMPQWVSIPTPFGRIVADEDGIAEKEITLKAGGSVTFEGLPEGVKYGFVQYENNFYMPRYKIAAEDAAGSNVEDKLTMKYIVKKNDEVSSAGSELGTSGSQITADSKGQREITWSGEMESIDGGVNETVTFINRRSTPQILPNTGGEGMMKYVVTAILFAGVFAAVTVCDETWRRRRRRR